MTLAPIVLFVYPGKICQVGQPLERLSQAIIHSAAADIIHN